MLARTLAATGLALALALTAAKPGQAEVVCDTESAEDGACDPGTAAKTVADGAGASAARPLTCRLTPSGKSSASI